MMFCDFDSCSAKIYRHDLHSGIVDPMGSHDDMATCIGYSNETCKLLTNLYSSFLFVFSDINFTFCCFTFVCWVNEHTR